MSWPALDLPTLFNMLIVAGLGFLGGLVTGWFSHQWAAKRDRKNWKWNELRDKQTRLRELERKMQEYKLRDYKGQEYTPRDSGKRRAVFDYYQELCSQGAMPDHDTMIVELSSRMHSDGSRSVIAAEMAYPLTDALQLRADIHQLKSELNL